MKECHANVMKAVHICAVHCERTFCIRKGKNFPVFGCIFYHMYLLLQPAIMPASLLQSGVENFFYFVKFAMELPERDPHVRIYHINFIHVHAEFGFAQFTIRTSDELKVSIQH